MHRLKDVLSPRGPSTVGPDASVVEAARRMAERNVGAILVLDGDNLLGIFSERDVMTRVVAEGLDPVSTPVRFVMSTTLATIDESATVEQAGKLMDEHKCRHLPVMREGKVVGVISMRELMHLEIDSKSDEIKHMQAYIQTGR
jgi:CBS domain-containing protein